MHSVLRRTSAHIAWILPAGTLFFMCGIFISRSSTSPYPGIFALCLTLLAVCLSCKWRRSLALLLSALSFGVLLGWQAYHPQIPTEESYRVRGTVVQEVALREDGQLQTVLTDVTLEGIPQPDGYWTTYLDEGEQLPAWLVPGAQLEMIAHVYAPQGAEHPGGFDFREYLLQRNIRYGIYGADSLTSVNRGFSLRGWTASVRHQLALHLMDVMGEESGAYAAAMLLGTRDFIPDHERAAFNQLGIAHILSISGYHVGILAGIMMLLLRPVPLSRGKRLALEAACLGAYCLLTGGNAPVIRAALLVVWREYTHLRHRQVLPLHILCVSALAQLIGNPTLLTSPSFQLTYSAMLGLTLIFPWLKKRHTFSTGLLQKTWEAFCAALAAQLGILAPQLYWFGELPLMAILLNMAVIFFTSGLMLLYWAVLFCLGIPGVREILGWIAAGATRIMLWAVSQLSTLDAVTLWTRQADVCTWLGWVLLIFSLSSLVPRRLARYRRGVTLVGTALILMLLIPLPENRVTYTQFSVGSADAAVLQDKDLTIVIDTGEDGQAIANHLHQQRQSVEALILTHLHIDHAGGIRALLDAGIPVDVCYLPTDAEKPAIDNEVLPLLEELRRTGTEFRFLCRGDVLPLPSGQLTVLWPEAGRVTSLHDANDVSLVLHADIAGTTMLLTGDLTGIYEKYVSLPADILKVAHHGSPTSTSPKFLAAVNPQVLLLSNSLDSRERRMAELAGSIPLYSTESRGSITVQFPGNGEFAVQPYR